jgi:DNA mismatch endonuclease, patch repair protein
MVDHLTSEQRSWNMSRIRSKNTKPELFLRSMLHNMGYRFRLNGKVSKRLHPKGILPGKPDIVLAKYRTVIFVHGCFWHRHDGCKGATTPKTRTDWWQAKFARNVERDKQNLNELHKLNWKVITIWECELKIPINIEAKITTELPRCTKYSQNPVTIQIAAEKHNKYKSTD